MAQDGICEACLFHWSQGVLSTLPNIEAFGCNVEEVMKNPTYLRTERTLDCIECFAGTATIYNAACARGHKAVAKLVVVGPNMSINGILQPKEHQKEPDKSNG